MSANNKKRLIVIVGPTAIGKTTLSIKLAQLYNCSVLSADSRQFYREMNIGTAKPSATEMQNIPHHFINTLSIHDEYSAGAFERDALAVLEDVFTTNDTAICVGGSGLFVNALCYGLDDIPGDTTVRAKLVERFENEGLAPLQEALKKADPAYYETADIQNQARVVRALEVFTITGKPYSSFRNAQPKERPFDIITIGLNIEREELYQNINKRVDLMIENGLQKEAIALEQYAKLTPLKTVGYQEFYPSVNSEQDLSQIVSKIKQNTRRFAKRQITFFKKNTATSWFSPNDFDAITKYIAQKSQSQ